MNWKKGFLRLWYFCAACWYIFALIFLAFLFFGVLNEKVHSDCYYGDADTCYTDAALVIIGEIIREIRNDPFLASIIVTVFWSPPFVVLFFVAAIVRVLRSIVRGFEPPAPPQERVSPKP